jgi:hypothetical protein
VRGEERRIEPRDDEGRGRPDDARRVRDDELRRGGAAGTAEVRGDGTEHGRVDLPRTVESHVALAAPAVRERGIEHRDGERVLRVRDARDAARAVHRADGRRIGLETNAVGDRGVPDAHVEALRRVPLEHLGGEHRRAAEHALRGDTRERGEERAPDASVVRRARDDEGANFAGVRRRRVEAVLLHPALDLPHEDAGALRHQVHVAPEHRVPDAHARVALDALRHVRVRARVLRARIAAPGLVHVP